MSNYAFHHLHHETKDVDTAVEFYQKLFAATTETPYERGGATWVHVHIGDVQVIVTDREFADMELGRYQGYDHLALSTDDFEATLDAIEKNGISIWTGPLTLDSGQRMVFVSGPDHVKIEIVEKD